MWVFVCVWERVRLWEREKKKKTLLSEYQLTQAWQTLRQPNDDDDDIDNFNNVDDGDADNNYFDNDDVDNSDNVDDEPQLGSFKKVGRSLFQWSEKMAEKEIGTL